MPSFVLDYWSSTHKQQEGTIMGVFQRIQQPEPIAIGSLCFWNEEVVRVVSEDGKFYVRVIDPTVTNDTGASNRAFARSLVVLTTEQADIKGLTLPVRREELLENITSGWRRLDGSDYRLMDRFRDMLYANYSNEIPNWFAKSVASSADDSRQISWATEPHYVDNDVRRKRGRPNTFLKYVVKTYGFNFSTQEIERLSYLIGEMLPKRDSFTFEITNGEGLYEYYQDDDGPQSCMRGETYVQMYADNPNACEMVVIKRDGEYFGRALLWHTDEGDTVLDRIYPNSGIHVELLRQMAIDNGWDYLRNQSYAEDFVSGRGYHVTIHKNDNGEFPYMDTFRFCNSDDISTLPFVLQNGECNWHYKLTETDGTPEHDASVCHHVETDEDGYRRHEYCEWYNNR
jgi:hypothetical protein